MKVEEPTKQEILNYKLQRADYLIKLAKEGLTENIKLNFGETGISPAVKLTKLSNPQKTEWLQTLENQKKLLLEELGILT